MSGKKSRHSRMFSPRMLVMLIVCARFASIGECGVARSISIESIPPAERLSFVLAALDARDNALSNSRFQLKETDTNIERVSGKRLAMGGDEAEFRRCGQVEWVHYVLRSSSGPAKVLAVSDINWDGKKCLGIGYPPYVSTSPDPAGRIDSKMNTAFVFTRYLEILGSHVHAKGGGLVLSMADLLRQCAAEGSPIVIRTDVLDGTPVVRLDVATGMNEQATFWFDPTKGLMPIGRDFTFGTAAHPLSSVTHRVLESKFVAGLWVPIKTRRFDDILMNSKMTESLFNISEFEIGTMKDSDVRITFPVGTHVMDATQNIGYIVRPEGKYELIRVASSAEQKVFDPPSEKIVSDPSTAGKLYTSGPLLTGTEPIYAARTGRWKRTLAVLGLLGLVAIVGWLHHRQRGTHNAKP